MKKLLGAIFINYFIYSFLVVYSFLAVPAFTTGLLDKISEIINQINYETT